MAKNLFTKEFYQFVYNEINKRLEEDFCPSEEVEETDGYVCIEEKPYAEDDEVIEISATVETENEWNDDSFDHAFGTWHDPCPCWKYGGITDIFNVEVTVNGDKVEGWNEADFWLSFIEDEYKEHKKGDIVQYMKSNKWSEDTAELVGFDTYHYRYWVKVEDEKIKVLNVREPKEV